MDINNYNEQNGRKRGQLQLISKFNESLRMLSKFVGEILTKSSSCEEGDKHKNTNMYMRMTCNDDNAKDERRGIRKSAHIK